MTIAWILSFLILAVISALSLTGTGESLALAMTAGHLTNFQELFQEAVMAKKSKRPRRSFSAEFKQAAFNLVVKQEYSFKAASDVVGVAVKSLRDWHAKLAREPEPCSDHATGQFSSS